MTIEKLGVIGCGVVGTALVEMAALAGIDVVAVRRTGADPSEVHARVARALDRHVVAGFLRPEGRDAALGRVHATGDLSALAGCPFAIEACPERLDIKRTMLLEIEAQLPSTATLASHTRALKLSALGQGLMRPCRFVGLRLSPAPGSRVAEVLPAPRTRPSVVEAAMVLLARMGRTPMGWGELSARMRGPVFDLGDRPSMV